MSNTPTIAEMNRVIARFMDLVPIPVGTKMLGDIKHPEKSEAFLRYDKLWDLLMPVYHIIRERAYELGRQESNLHWVRLREQLVYGRIADVHLKVYDFITWYNNPTITPQSTEALMNLPENNEPTGMPLPAADPFKQQSNEQATKGNL